MLSLGLILQSAVGRMKVLFGLEARLTESWYGWMYAYDDAATWLECRTIATTKGIYFGIGLVGYGISWGVSQIIEEE